MYPLPGRVFVANNVITEPHSRASRSLTFRNAVTDVSIGGSVSLQSGDPYDSPLIDMGLLTHDFDIMALKEGVAAIRRFISASTFKEYNLTLLYPFTDESSDKEIEDAIRSVVASNVHPVGTAAMSPKGAEYGVVDPDLKVKKVSGLRVVDGSVMVRRKDRIRGGKRFELMEIVSVAIHHLLAHPGSCLRNCRTSIRHDSGKLEVFMKIIIVCSDAHPYRNMVDRCVE